MNRDEVLKLALEALEDLGMKHFESTGEVLYKETFTAIKEALAQPDQEPFAWANLNALSEQINSVNCGTVYRLPFEAEGRQPLYTTTPQRKPLTDGEIQDALPGYRLVDAIDIARAIEAAHGIKEGAA